MQIRIFYSGGFFCTFITKKMILLHQRKKVIKTPIKKQNLLPICYANFANDYFLSDYK